MDDQTQTQETQNVEVQTVTTVAAPKRGRLKTSTEPPAPAKAPKAAKAAKTAKPAPAPKATKAAATAPKAKRPEAEISNGVRRPQSGATRAIWDFLDGARKSLKRAPLVNEVRDQFSDRTPAMVSANYAAWCKFHGVSRADRNAAREKAAAKK